MRTLKQINWRKPVIYTLLVMLFIGYSGAMTPVQSQEIQLDEIEDQTRDALQSAVKIIKWITIVGAAIGVIVVVYMVATNHPKSREVIIGWFTGVIILALAWAILPEIN
jgi:enamine deaminase RidA (YjgF/YER057c/UK114 family)